MKEDKMKLEETTCKLENEVVQSNALLEAIEDILNGESTSDFMLSFPVVRRVEYLMIIKNSYEGLWPQK